MRIVICYIWLFSSIVECFIDRFYCRYNLIFPIQRMTKVMMLFHSWYFLCIWFWPFSCQIYSKLILYKISNQYSVSILIRRIGYSLCWHCIHFLYLILLKNSLFSSLLTFYFFNIVYIILLIILFFYSIKISFYFIQFI